MFKLFIFLVVFEAINVQCFTYCSENVIPQDISENDGAALVKQLVRLKRNLENVGVKLKLIIALDENDSSILKKRKEYLIDYGTIWKHLQPEGEIPHAYIFDRCGKLTYEVIFPWSLTEFPYLKAAVLSTLYDKPCSGCDHLTSQIKEELEEIKLPVFPKVPRYYDGKKQKDGTLPVEIVFKERHLHEGSDGIYEYLERRLGDPNYHGHFDETWDGDFQTDFLENLDDFQDVIRFEDINQSGESHAQFGHTKFRKLEPPTIDTKITSANDNEPKESSGESSSLEFDDEFLQEYYLNLENTLFSPAGETSEEADQVDIETVNHYRKILNWVSYII